MSGWLERPVDATAEELRVCWRSGREVSLALEAPPAAYLRVRGVVAYVALTGAYALVREPRAAEPTHVPLGVVLSVRTLHFTEPADALPQEADPMAGQLPLW